MQNSGYGIVRQVHFQNNLPFTAFLRQLVKEYSFVRSLAFTLPYPNTASKRLGGRNKGLKIK